jgi:hypothetical protein
MGNVLIIGSINIDLVVRTDTFPRLGETLFGGFLDPCRRQRIRPGGRRPGVG